MENKSLKITLLLLTIIVLMVVAQRGMYMAWNASMATNVDIMCLDDVPSVGGYGEYEELLESDKALFEAVYHGERPLTPKAVATQVVAGTNYRFLCSDTEGNEYLVTIFEPLPCYQSEQPTEVTSVEAL